MRTLRQILHGCNKHHYKYSRTRLHYLGGKGFKLMASDHYTCVNCGSLEIVNVRPASLRKKPIVW